MGNGEIRPLRESKPLTWLLRPGDPHINVCKNQFNAASIESEAAVELIFATVQPVKRAF